MTENNVMDMADTKTKGNKSETRDNFDYDGFWKDLIKRFFPFLLKRALPELYKKADFKKEPRFLDTEFRDILNTGKREIHKNPHFADFLIEVPLKNGKSEWILFHIESQQGPGGGNITERMKHYHCCIYAHYRREPVALAIIASGRRKKERFYSHSHFGTEIIYRYNNVVLAELDDAELKESDNPIDLALYAAKCALKAKDETRKYKYLRTLLVLLSKRGWSDEDKRDLLLFLERIIDLSDKGLKNNTRSSGTN